MKAADSSLAELDGGPPTDVNSIFHHIENGLRNHPHNPATIILHQPADHLQSLVTQDADFNEGDTTNGATNVSGRCLQWTYTQLHRAVVNLTAGLMANGIQPGMRIATFIPNGAEYPLSLWTSALMRVTLCSLDPGAVTKARRKELKTFMTSLNPDVVMVLDQQGAQAVDEVFQQAGTALTPLQVKIVLERGRDLLPSWTTLLDLAALGKKQPLDEEKLMDSARNDDPDRTALIMFTSGTSTGDPKGCPRTVSSIAHVVSSQIQDEFMPGRLGADTRFLASSANFRIIAPSFHFDMWAVGGCAVMPDPAAGSKGQIAAIRDHKVNLIVFIPALLHAMVAEPEFKDLDVSHVKAVILGGDMITNDMFKLAHQHFPRAAVSNGHGMTEGGGLNRWPFFKMAIDEIPYFNDICPMGVVAPGVRLRIRDPDSGETVKRNETGELCVCSSYVLKRYLGNKHEGSFFEDDQGRWFRTGDLAMIDGEDRIYILGRIKDIIKRSGIPITPAALESCISSFTGATTSVMAWPHPTLGHEPLAVLQDLNGKTDDQIREQVLQMFGKDYSLGPVMTLKQLGLETFPLNATGKIMKSELLTCMQDLTQ